MKRRWSLRGILAAILIFLGTHLTNTGQAVKKAGLGLAEAAVKGQTWRAAAERAEAAAENKAAGAATVASQEAVQSGEHESGGFLHTLAHRGLHKALEYGWDKAKEVYNDYTESDKKKEPVYDPGFQYRPPYNRSLKPQNQFSWSTQNTVSPTGGLKSGVVQTNSSK
jgi:hypothetical protein